MRIVLILSFLVVIPFISTAHAGEPYGCGVPLVTGEDSDAKMPTETGGRCDIHDRRFTYREEGLKMQQLIKDRQENYMAPHKQIKDQYREKLEALNQERGTPSDIDSYDDAEPGHEGSYLIEDKDDEEDWNLAK